MLAVEVDYETGKAVIGTKAGQAVQQSEILAAIESIGYSGRFAEK